MTIRNLVIFDLDGTLIDTEVIWDEVRRELAAGEGLTWPDAATPAMMGMSTREWSGYLVDTVGFPGTSDEVAERVIGALELRYRDHLPVLPGAVEAVRRLAAAFPVAVASSSPRRLIETSLSAMGVRELMTVVRSTEEGSGRGKPAPDAFLWVCEHLGADPTRTVVIEDSSNGIRAGHAAGMHVVAIPPPFEPPTAEVLALADVILEDLDGLTVRLVSELSGRGVVDQTDDLPDSTISISD